MPYSDAARRLTYWRERYRRLHPAKVLPPDLVPFLPGRRVGYIVDVATGCWNWYGGHTSGYGEVYIHDRRGPALAHRMYWERTNGPIPAGLEPDHLCRNRNCVNPAHLELVTRKVNARRGAMAKLTPALAQEIRLRHASGGIGYRRLAAEYGVHRSTIQNLITGHRGRWRD